nr:EOG090X06E6 [Eurycercus lamellatus]
MATVSKVQKRVRVTRKPKSSQNPLFEKWLQEMKEDAEKKDLKTKYAYGKALKSLQKYPLRLHSGKECKVLAHFGAVLCDQLDKRLEKYVSEGGILESESDLSSKESPRSKKVSRNSTGQNENPSRTAGYLKKSELQEAAQPYADVSFTQTNIVDSQYYSAWSSMSTLIKKELVEKIGNPAKYMLTETGRILAIKLNQAETDLYSSPSTSSGYKSGPSVSNPSTKTTTQAIKDVVGLSSTNLKTASPPKIIQQDDVIHIDEDEFDQYLLPTLSRSEKFVEPPKINVNIPQLPPVTASIATKKTVAKASTVKKPDPVTSTSSIATKSGSFFSNGILEPEDIIFIEDNDLDHQLPKSTLANFHRGSSEPRQSIESIQDDDVNEEENIYPHENITLKPGEYDIILCVDNAEVAGNRQKDTAAKAFQNCGVPVDVRKLAIGDYLWICKPKPGSGINPDHELILPFVVERKRLDDLVSSIKDGRFKEQKFRLINSGLCRPIYLVEEFGNRQNLGLPEASIMQAIANTLLIEKFQVQWTKSSNESVAYLVEMTKQCTQLYKPLSVTEMLVKHLMQLHGLSVEKSEEIVKRYPTLASLMEAYNAAGPSASQLLANIEYGKSGKAKRKIGSSLSGTLAMLYTQPRFES